MANSFPPFAPQPDLAYAAKRSSAAPTPPQFRRSFLSSLSNRIMLTIVAVGFLSALVSGVVYAIWANSLFNQAADQAAENVRTTLITRLDNSALPQRLKTQFEEAVKLREPFTPTRNLVKGTLAQAIAIVVVVAISSALLAFGLGWLLTRRLAAPLEKLRQASQQVATGDFTPRVEVGSQDEVGQVAYSFNLMAERLQGTENRRRALLSDVAHELKTPLASIQGHVEALRDNLPRAKADPDAIYSIVLEDVAELDRMVGSFRGWLTAQSMLENIEIKPLALAEELPNLLERFRPRATSAGIELSLQLDVANRKILADRNALRQMLSNLLDNALRYTPAGGKIQLKAWLGEGEKPRQGSPQRVTLAVADTGCGIAPEHWPHLFERFYRVDKSRSRDTGGTGLGLALVKELATAQGGRVWLNSRVGQGTIFFVSLSSI
jgi:two-component system, OmpR family, sensor histidine kinase BaeS